MSVILGYWSFLVYCSLHHRVAERQMRTTGLSSCILYSRLCWLPSSCKSSIGIPLEFAILLQRARTKLDWEFATLYSSVYIVSKKAGFSLKIGHFKDIPNSRATYPISLNMVRERHLCEHYQVRTTEKIKAWFFLLIWMHNFLCVSMYYNLLVSCLCCGVRS